MSARRVKVAPASSAAAQTTPGDPREPAEPAAPAPPVTAREPVLRRLIRKPLVYLPLLVIAGALLGYVAGALRLAARERAWQTERGRLEQVTTDLETSLQVSKAQEVSYRIVVLLSRVVVDLYDGNLGLAAEDLRAARAALRETTSAQDSELSARLDGFQLELEELGRQLELLSASARETLREVERQATDLLIPRGS